MKRIAFSLIITVSLTVAMVVACRGAEEKVQMPAEEIAHYSTTLTLY